MDIGNTKGRTNFNFKKTVGRKIGFFTFCFSGFTSFAHSNYDPKLEVSCGAGVLYVANCDIGISASHNLDVTLDAGGSILINIATFYIDYTQTNNNGVVKYGVGPSYIVGCWEDACNGKIGFGFHRKSVKVPLNPNWSNWYYDVGLNVTEIEGRYIYIPKLSLGFSFPYFLNN